MTVATTAAAVTAAGAVAIVGVIWPLVSWRSVATLEKPKFWELRTLGNKKRAFYDREPAITLRKYASYLVAEVTIEGKENMRDALSDGFRQVANYIFGNNLGKGAGASEKIAMTSPVASKQQESDFRSMKGGDGEKIAMTSPVGTDMQGSKFVVSFMMPPKYHSTDDLPKPKNPSLRLREVPAQTRAALSWRGGPRPTEEMVEAKKAELLAALRAEGVKVDAGASPQLLQYYPPFAPRWMRLQEVTLPVEDVLGVD